MLIWDLLTELGKPITGGLYRAQVQVLGRGEAAQASTGAALAPQLLFVGVVRQRVQ